MALLLVAVCVRCGFDSRGRSRPSTGGGLVMSDSDDSCHTAALPLDLAAGSGGLGGGGSGLTAGGP